MVFSRISLDSDLLNFISYKISSYELKCSSLLFCYMDKRVSFGSVCILFFRIKRF